MLIIGSFLSNIGTWMQLMAQGWLVRELTPSPFLIGFVSFAGSIPQLAFSLFSGVYADTFDRRRLLLGTQTMQMMLSSLLGLLVALRLVTIWYVIAISFASGLLTTLATPTYHAFVHDIVGRDSLPSAISLNATQYNLSRIIGPVIAGIMLSMVGIAGCFYANALSFLTVILALALIRVTTNRRGSLMSFDELLRQTTAGIGYMRNRPRVLGVLEIAAVVSLFGIPFLIFMPVFARDVLRTDARGLSWMMAATGTGAVIFALLQAAIARRLGRGNALIAGLFLFGVTVILFSLSRNILLSLSCLAIMGGAMVSVTANTNTLLQTLVRDEMRGRVLSMYSLVFLGLPPVGSLLIGAMADLIGHNGFFHSAQIALAAGGVIILAFGLYV
ncbi:MAG: MFS transporter, partial [Blastocatellia bacterium]